MIPGKLFLDTGSLVARELTRDQYHKKAVDGWGSIRQSNCLLYCSEHVLDEATTLLSRRRSYAFASKCALNYIKSELIQWLPTTESDLENAIMFMRKYADQAVSFTDCISFVLMKRRGIKHIFSFDRHFEAAQSKDPRGKPRSI